MFTINLRFAFLLLFVICCVSGCSKRSSGGYSSSSSPSSFNPTPAPTSDTTSTPTAVAEGSAAPALPTHPAFTRPTLIVWRGEYFTYAMPADWQAHETGNGVDMNSPDGRLVASAELLSGSQGETTPWAFVYWALANTGCTNINGISRLDLPSRESVYPGAYWQIQEFDLTFTDQSGLARRGDVTAAICNAYGGHSALMQGYSAPLNDFDQAKTWLPLVASSVNAIDPNRVAYQNQLIPVQNHPLDNTGLMESWQEKRLSQDRIAKAQREGMMGYERMMSPSTGRYYNMPLELYDGTVGGYRDPDHPTEVLSPTQPGN